MIDMFAADLGAVVGALIFLLSASLAASAAAPALRRASITPRAPQGESR